MGESDRDFDVWTLLCQHLGKRLQARQPLLWVARAKHPAVCFVRFLVANVFSIENGSALAADLAARL